MHLSSPICSLFVGMLIFTLTSGCGVSQRCDPNEDEGYCEDNVAITCGRVNDTERFEWVHRDCSNPMRALSPYCVEGEHTSDPSLPKGASCSMQSEPEPLCYQENPPLCKGELGLSCGEYGSAFFQEFERCPETSSE